MIDVLITSASRLNCLEKTLDSMYKNLEYSGKLRVILHEDVVIKSKSNQVEAWVKDKVDLFIKTNPAQRMGKAVVKCLPHITTKYFIKWEDDWELLKKVQIDDILEVMEEHSFINQVALNPLDNGSYTEDKVFCPMLDFGKVKLTQTREWIIGLSICRTAFVKKHWPDTSDGEGIISVLGTYDLKEKRDMEWMKNNVGCYFYGGWGEGGHMKHLGIDKNIRWHHAIEE